MRSQDALSIVKKENPKLIFLDIQMLGMSGLDVLKEIKKIDKSIRVVMLTVVSDEATKQNAKELGADDFVTKPFMSEHLEEVAYSKITELIKERPPEKPKILVVGDEEEVYTHLPDLFQSILYAKLILH